MAAATSHLASFVVRPTIEPGVGFVRIVRRTISVGRRIGSPAVAHSMRLPEFAPQAQPLLQIKRRSLPGLRQRSRRTTEDWDEQQK
jgi:hypothetical protein